MWGDHVLLLTAQGATSGVAITTPLVYGRDGAHYVIVASKGGAPKHPAWFGNIKANPEVESRWPTPTGRKGSQLAPEWSTAGPTTSAFIRR